MRSRDALVRETRWSRHFLDRGLGRLVGGGCVSVKSRFVDDSGILSVSLIATGGGGHLASNSIMHSQCDQICRRAAIIDERSTDVTQLDCWANPRKLETPFSTRLGVFTPEHLGRWGAV